MNTQEIWNCETPIAELLDCDIPAWIEQDICAMTVASICNGGCASGSYMPAVTYYQALRTMSDYGDEVLQYIEQMAELPNPFETFEEISWSGMACYFLSMAVELWAGDIMAQLENLEADDE